MGRSPPRDYDRPYAERIERRQVAYELTWVDDPHAEQRAIVRESFPRLFAGFPSFEALQGSIRAMHRSMEAIGGYLQVPDALMRSLIAEMGAQGMFEGDDDIRARLEAQGGILTVDEIDRLFSRIEWPYTLTDEILDLVLTEFDRRQAEFSAENPSDYVTGAEAVAMLSPLGWAKSWFTWLAFLDEARGHGGVEIG